ncbi:hypothetical protein C8046_11005 [Serinibacter arcticus]|uniref:Zinc finger DksA/TraR C4-type domain-containing protein n=1 Tax=Serinibacter arcticus TaxID=1655435 RepID=A0A2U1ZVT9_9MICO|nr:TraR/DksA C4-type zinc finger protein [Serinibacter arcticus]PWD51098.1 hypothetical protein C8046_11005 [Serinibacter arcticus]
MDDDVARDRLLALREETLRRVAGLGTSRDDVVAAALDSNVDDEHDPEGATIAFEREQLSALLTQARGRLGEIDAALVRVEAGTYGVCETCGEPIGDERLEARPTASRCVRHA